MTRLAARLVRIVAPIVLACAAIAPASAQPFTFHTLIDPSWVPDADPGDLMGFGQSVSVGDTPWLAVGAPGADCPASRTSPAVVDAGRVFLFKRVNGAWQHHQSLCGTSPQAYAQFGVKVDMADGWLVIGQPYAANGTIPQAGRVSFYRLDAATGYWQLQQATSGTTANARLGTDVAIDGGIIVAGEPYVSNGKGRVRSWRVSSGALVALPHYTPAGVLDNEYFGSAIDVYSRGCTTSSCADFVDALVVQTQEKLRVAVRGAGGWVANQTIAAPGGTSWNTNASLSIGHYTLATQVSIPSGSTAPCPTGYAVRVYSRQSGNAYAPLGYACPHAGALITFGKGMAVARGSSTFFVGAPDAFALGGQPHADPASFGVFDAWTSIQHMQMEYEFGLAPVVPGQAFLTYNDAFATSLSHFSSYLAVGAPFAMVYTGGLGTGYVAVYRDCC